MVQGLPSERITIDMVGRTVCEMLQLPRLIPCSINDCIPSCCIYGSLQSITVQQKVEGIPGRKPTESISSTCSAVLRVTSLAKPPKDVNLYILGRKHLLSATSAALATMEFQALHGLAKKLMGVEAIRREVLKVLNEDETFHELQNDLAVEHRSNSGYNGGLRRRLPTSRTVRSAEAGADQMDDPDVHVDTLTEPSTAPGSPRSDQGRPRDDTLDVSSDWDDSAFELLPGPRSSARGDTAQQNEPAESGTDGIGAKLARWLHTCSQSIARAVGGVCQGAVTLAKGIVKDCSKLMKDVATWCQQSIDGLRKQICSMPRWAKIAGGVVAVAVLMGAIVMMMLPPPPLLPGLL